MEASCTTKEVIASYEVEVALFLKCPLACTSPKRGLEPKWTQAIGQVALGTKKVARTWRWRNRREGLGKTILRVSLAKSHPQVHAQV